MQTFIETISHLHMIGVSVATLQNWEQGRRKPEGPARALLQVALRNPEAVKAALTSSNDARQAS